LIALKRNDSITKIFAFVQINDKYRFQKKF
jgi:hypothetical protein